MSIQWKSKDEIKTEQQQSKKEIEKQKAMEKLAQMQAVSIASTLPKEKLLEIKALFPEWRDLIGKAIKKVDYPYILDDGVLYNLQQDTTVQEQFKPSMPGMLAIFAPVLKDPTVEGPQPWKMPVPPQTYGKGEEVTHAGYVWESVIDGNVWEPTAYPQGWKVVM